MIKPVVLTAVIVGACQGVCMGAEKFDNVAVYLEQTAEDEDSEVTFEAISDTAGLAALKSSRPMSAPSSISRPPIPSWDAAPHAGIARTEERRQASGRLPGRRLPVYRDQHDRRHAAGRGEAGPRELPAVTRILRPRPDEKNVPIAGLQVDGTRSRTPPRSSWSSSTRRHTAKSGRTCWPPRPRSPFPKASCLLVLNTRSRLGLWRRMAIGHSPRRHSRQPKEVVR